MNVVHVAIRTIFIVGGIAAVFLIAVVGNAKGEEVIFSEGFEDGSNTGGWSYGTLSETIVTVGGNPDAYFGVTNYAAPFPLPRTTQVSVFTGNYRSKQVTSVGLDTSIFYVNLGLTEGRPMSVILISYNETPTDYSDDWGAYFVGPKNIPAEGAGWDFFDINIPSQATSLPPGWDFIRFGPSSPTSFDWNNIITDVGMLSFHYGHPAMMAIFQDWDMGIDNMRITMELSPGDANCNGVVDDDDATIVAANWLTTDASWKDGDFDGDGLVNDVDVTLIAANWGSSGTTVPEPSVLVMLSCVGLWLLTRRTHAKR